MLALACGCEHHEYGDFLREVGRNEDATVEYRRGVDVLALNGATQDALAWALLETGHADEAKTHTDAAVDLSNDPKGRNRELVLMAPATHDYAAALKALDDVPDLAPPAIRAAWTAAFRALLAPTPQATSAAVSLLAAAPSSQGRSARTTISLLGLLGAHAQALGTVQALAKTQPWRARMALLSTAMAGTRADPGFAQVAEQLGLIRYWRASHTRPDFCKAAGAPAICGTI
jgi:hypothetical protein